MSEQGGGCPSGALAAVRRAIAAHAEWAYWDVRGVHNGAAERAALDAALAAVEARIAALERFVAAWDALETMNGDGTVGPYRWMAATATLKAARAALTEADRTG